MSLLAYIFAVAAGMESGSTNPTRVNVGAVTAVKVRDNQQVKRGQLLFQRNQRTGEMKDIDHVYLAGSLIAQKETPVGGGTVNTNANEGGVGAGNSVGSGEAMRVDYVIDLTGTPVPGGLTTHQALSIIRGLKGMDFKGMDVVEVSPPFDHAELTSTAAAIIAVELLCLKAWARGARGETPR